jgi:hypothetical protein
VDLNLPSLPHAVGNVNEVRCISEPDLTEGRPANTSIDWSKLKFAKRNPLEFFVRSAWIETMKPFRKIRNYFKPPPPIGKH